MGTLIKYTLFSALSIIVNLGSQAIIFLLSSQWYNFYIALIVGTGSGLVLKYMLDKKYIFYHIPRSKSDDIKKFTLYTMMGGITTFIFWVVEYLFFKFVPMEFSQYIGGGIGLIIGYYIKYKLDKRFVFTHNKECV